MLQADIRRSTQVPTHHYRQISHLHAGKKTSECNRKECSRRDFKTSNNVRKVNYNKTGNVSMKVTLRRVRVDIVAGEKR